MFSDETKTVISLKYFGFKHAEVQEKYYSLLKAQQTTAEYRSAKTDI